MPHPEERCLVFDVEVAVTEDPRAVMAAAVTSLAWYSWLPASQTSSVSWSQDLGVDLLEVRGKARSPPQVQHCSRASCQVLSDGVLR